MRVEIRRNYFINTLRDNECLGMSAKHRRKRLPNCCQNKVSLLGMFHIMGLLCGMLLLDLWRWTKKSCGKRYCKIWMHDVICMPHWSLVFT